MRDPTSPQHQRYISEVAPQITMERYLSSGFNEELDNPQTRFLAGLYGQDNALPYGECSGEMLEQAISNLQNHFMFAGITEEFDASVLLLQDLLGWRTPFYHRVNIGKNRLPNEEISPQALEAIHYNTRYDRQLYEHVVREFHARIHAQSPQFQARLAAFPAANSRYWQRRQHRQDAINVIRKPLGIARRRLMRLLSG